MPNYTESRRQQVARRRFESKELLTRLKTGPCVRCKDPDLQPCQMDLVRPDGSGPAMASLLGKSRKRILEEAQRRLLLCSNCNRIRDFNRKRAAMEGES